MLFRNRASSNLYQPQIANLKKGRLTLEGSLIIKGNYYYAKFRVDGKQKMIATKIPVKGNNKRRAEQKMREIVAAYQGLNLECDNALFTDFLNKWLKSIEGIIKLSTWETYDKTVNGKIKPYFEPKHYRFRDMKPETFTEYFVYLAQHGKSNGKGGLGYKTVKNIQACCHRLMSTPLRTTTSRRIQCREVVCRHFRTVSRRTYPSTTHSRSESSCFTQKSTRVISTYSCF